ncbi:MAG: PadR family transcriptional regulator [Acidimicrobiales bacterium]
MGTDQPSDRPPELSLTEWTVLALLAEAPTHGFGIAKELRAGTDLGRIITVHRPLVYRALDRLVAAGLAEPHVTEPGDAGPNRTVHRATDPGCGAVEQWLDQPVAHIRDLRIEFLAKLRLNQRRARDAGRLVAAQREALADTFDQLTGDEPADVVDMWRRSNATAARQFLDRLAELDASPGGGPSGP